MEVKKIIAVSTVALFGLGFGLSTTPAFATTTSVTYGDNYTTNTKSWSGGTWQYGYTLTNAYSQYYMANQAHGAKIINVANGACSIFDAKGGQYATASIGDLWDQAAFYANTSTY
ncbi:MULTISPECIES: lactococcin 972 family bacteriocin [unclassified Lactococcus]|uniref:lactococcin 972 family bacteriocin n=1 Tax=unclassified Lactococcus TaxID=2643510 RepID=UPI0011CCA75B|nr:MULTISPECIES: lactococcin 972 family bacteriocin [unclassified Lactococcus]MQW22925.1 lactococcin 972 family bacteriocin [Lactococcus sp. dk101]TXK44528.1 lactococcin 972 family bacteriocin [Lactococcus sp. dk310]TXK50381.1 lactococcin 972 family bacteriocin [Lactococcus sp. dk322]